MNLNHSLFLCAFALAACTHDPEGVNFTHDGPPTTTPAIPAKVEPVFYNGKTYKVSISSNADGTIAMRIAGMAAGQDKDATALATSTLHHFACKDSQNAVLSAPPAFDGTGWFAAGRCA